MTPCLGKFQLVYRYETLVAPVVFAHRHEPVALECGDKVLIREAAVFMQAVCNLAMATKTLIAQERKAYNLDSKPERQQDEFVAFLADSSARGSRLPI